MEAYLTGRLVSVDVGEKPLDDGSHFVNVGVLQPGGRNVVSFWTTTGSPEFAAIESFDPMALPVLGITARLVAKKGNYEGAAPYISGRLLAVYALDADGRPLEAVAATNGAK